MILTSEKHDRQKALTRQKELLLLKKERLERLISAIDSAAKGTTVMKAFDKSEFENYKQEVKEKTAEELALEQGYYACCFRSH